MHTLFLVTGLSEKQIILIKLYFLGSQDVFGNIQGKKLRKRTFIIKQELERAIQENIGFTNALSMATNDARNVIKVYEMIHDIIQEA